VRLAYLLLAAASVLGQAQDVEDFQVFTDAPRLFLTRARLRLLQRERERQSMRWQQFDALVAGGATLPEPGFGWALYYRVSGDSSVGQRAIAWALSDAGQDLRQLALVFDWCSPILTDGQKQRLSSKIEKAMAAPSADFRQQDARALAAIAIADRLSDHGSSVLRQIGSDWWRNGAAKQAEAGKPAIPREQIYPLFELIHAFHDNLRLDLTDYAPEFFKALAMDHLSSHYPAPLDAPENQYRVPVYVREGDPDISNSIFSRAAELAMVAFDPNAGDNQYLQGFLMQDRYLMRSALGAPYEFLWANPYQPGLSYFQAPLIFHNPVNGHLFARTGWEEDAAWVGYFDGHLQLYENGQIQTLKPGSAIQPLHIGDTLVVSAPRFQAKAKQIFVLGLTPGTTYGVEIDDQEVREERTDSAGILTLDLRDPIDAGVRIQRAEEMAAWR